MAPVCMNLGWGDLLVGIKHTWIYHRLLIFYGYTVSFLFFTGTSMGCTSSLAFTTTQ